jgi:hypothetical protein
LAGLSAQISNLGVSAIMISSLSKLPLFARVPLIGIALIAASLAAFLVGVNIARYLMLAG